MKKVTVDDRRLEEINRQHQILSENPSGPMVRECRLSVQAAGAMLRNLTSTELQFAASAIDALRRNRGSITPIEEFVTDTLWQYAKGYLAPDLASMNLEEFRANVLTVKESWACNRDRNPEWFEATGEPTSAK